MLLDKILEMLLYAKHSFNGHPPLGVNATELLDEAMRWAVHALFQWAPTLGGECYLMEKLLRAWARSIVSMGTHPWG